MLFAMTSTNGCPKCRAATLRPLQSAKDVSGLAGLPQRCNRCRGFWVTLSSIGALEASGALSSVDEDSIQAESDQRTGLCPEGHGILARAKASWTRPFYVERCLVCAGLWLDAGEWKRLSAEHLLGHLEDLWVPSWRKQMQQAHSAQQLREMFANRLGPELTRRVEALASELAAHEHADLGFAVFQETFEAKRPRGAK
jgi:Zn-finger nucleic acid-binding protein